MHFITLRITGKALPLDAIKQRLGASPKYEYRMGETRRTKHGDVTYKEDGILYQAEIPKTQDLSAAVEAFAEGFFGASDLLLRLSETQSVTLWLSLYPEETQLNFSLSPALLTRLAACGIEFAVSVLSLDEFYNG